MCHYNIKTIQTIKVDMYLIKISLIIKLYLIFYVAQINQELDLC